MSTTNNPPESSSTCQPCKDMSAILDKPVPEPSNKDKQEVAAELLKLMNAKQCETKSGGFSAEADLFGGVVASTAISGAFSTSIGCESLAVMTQSYTEARERLTRLMNCTCREVSNNVIVMKNIHISFTRSQVKVRRFVISQKTSIRLVSTSSFTDAVMNEMSSVVQTMLNSVADVAQKTATDIGSPQSTQKSIQDLQQTINSKDTLDQLNQNISSMMTRVSDEQNLSLDFVDTVIEQDEFIIEQDTFMDLTVSNILNSNLHNMFKNDTVVDVFTSAKVVQEAENKGLSDIVEAQGQGGWVKLLAGGIGLVVVLGIVGAMYMRGSGSSAAAAQTVSTANRVVRLLISTVIAVLCSVGAVYTWPRKKSTEGEEEKTTEEAEATKPMTSRKIWLGISSTLIGLAGLSGLFMFYYLWSLIKHMSVKKPDAAAPAVVKANKRK